jgi:hypothetical protein
MPEGRKEGVGFSKPIRDYGVKFLIRVRWNPPDQSKEIAAYKEKLAQYEEDKRRLTHQEYVKAVRDRVKLAGDIRPRASTDLRAEERMVLLRKLVERLTKLTPDPERYVGVELLRTMFDVDRMLYFVAPEWWLPQTRYGQTLGVPAGAIGSEDKAGWGGVGELERDNYLVTEDSVPAPFGASLGWLLQLDGDEHRNAFLNAPWVKAVIPIQPGEERAALHWLELESVEGTDGLWKDGAASPLRESLLELADAIGSAGTDIKNILSTERVFEHGFDPLAGGFRSPGTPDAGTPFALFDQWTEVLPTDQVVAVEYSTPKVE